MNKLFIIGNGFDKAALCQVLWFIRDREKSPVFSYAHI